MIELTGYKDINEASPEIRSIIHQIELYRINGNMDGYYELLNLNIEALKPYIVTNESFNKIEREMYGLATDIIGTQRIIVKNSEPLEPCATYSEWLQPY